MRKIKLAVMLSVLTFALSACALAPLVVGGAAGGAVYSTTSDHIKDVFSISKEHAFETMVGIIAGEDGKITLSSITDGKIEARLGDSLLFVAISPLNETSTEVSIRAKKHMELIPDKDTAVRIYRAFVREVMK
ncbi:hypothetical protein Dacet_1410 [Denitrovibrio acetiphilus DSM 12809]|jgi:hypothetical protein|uniref:DUF3568 family protein n=1 Tax=Denitrovibrio acetiphilus (strain DSM 12809 / NBRC 114555 / N2460) TaxID=522772 RepID=D4H831_DENA2|nr:DUF3568 family protein [Denitrovibrio acetiphilus]ADD68180.1 hypothetical protein Dacet_1410 [Denitrovibrio acetiphilus DSM 12809]